MGTTRILLIENARSKRSSFADGLRKRYEVEQVGSGKQAVLAAGKNTPAVIVLDAISMRTSGERICQSLREKLGDTPIVHLHPGPKNGVDSPADSVLFLPFTARKLVNSIERLLTNDKPHQGLLVCGPFAVNLERRVLIAQGQETVLTPKLALLVELFMRHPGETIDRKTLMERVWQTDYLGDTRTLDVHIRWIRRAIEVNPSKPRYLMTVRGVGYRLDVPPEDGVTKRSDAALAAH